MYPIGHLGVALALSAPFVAVLRPRVATRFTVLALLAATIPDLDLFVPGATHHGVTHTLGFAVAVGLAGLGVFAAASTLASPNTFDSTAPVPRVAVFYAVALSLGVFGHVAADVLMLLPASQPVSPLWPISHAPVRVETLQYGNTVRNLGTFCLGLGAHAVAVGWSARGVRVRALGSRGIDEED
ncbi:metal-dependent hydrolase [Natronoarchaeum mannanilyticum]|uniref:Metal-dependent hydrolase n=1 Tax=Natronoarchaeum mannanilyticum TaxID=926360 RepID=A0AAV3TBU4_9EURY